MSEYSTGGKECEPERKGNVPQQARNGRSKEYNLIVLAKG